MSLKKWHASCAIEIGEGVALVLVTFLRWWCGWSFDVNDMNFKSKSLIFVETLCSDFVATMKE